MTTGSGVGESDPQADATPEQVVADFERRARHFETPCGDGSIIWHAWGDGPPVLLAHGAQGSWTHWIRNIDALAATRTVWAPDLPGYGASAMPPREDHATISKIIASGLERLIPEQFPIDFVGFSFGGVASAYFAGFYPELVRRLILVDTGGLDTPLGKVEMRGVRGLNAQQRKEANRANLLALMLHHPDSVDELALHVQALNGSVAKLNPIPLVLPDKLLEALPKVPVQVDAIWGEFDHPHPDPHVQEEVFRKFFPNMDFRMIPGAGHWVMYERPEEFNQALLELLDQPLR